eukprot:4363057-Prorocentrum_lima.AAC.1
MPMRRKPSEMMRLTQAPTTSNRQRTEGTRDIADGIDEHGGAENAEEAGSSHGLRVLIANGRGEG